MSQDQTLKFEHKSIAETYRELKADQNIDIHINISAMRLMNPVPCKINEEVKLGGDLVSLKILPESKLFTNINGLR